MGRALWLLDYLSEDGLNPAYVPGWEKRGFDGLDAEVVVGHHIGIAGGGEAPGLHLVTFGHGKLKGNALCNVHGGRSGRPTVVASGVAWHAGLGGFAGVSGNRKALGVEAEGTVGEWMDDRQYDGYARTCASMLRGLRREEGRFCTHHDWRFEKPDAWALIHTRGGTAAFRQRIRSAPHPIVTPPVVEEDEMEIWTYREDESNQVYLCQGIGPKAARVPLAEKSVLFAMAANGRISAAAATEPPRLKAAVAASLFHG